ncbi:MAG: 3,4-dihydroxy-2-butanone-4-phosphate synthase, partial [Proteobacteria bacterium]|nr:3,4-dihydroxy-2-butanone-4-phosphate synthase [Pseudomonadota bacterium]
IPAQMTTPDAINFMAKHGRGLICLAMTRERSEHLKLPMMAEQNRTPNQTAFTVSIEAKQGVTTGISAHDRARTVSVAIDPTKGADDIVMPGHVFPLVARDGGVLIRAGHTEAAVDIARLTGLYPAGVICEIMNEDGTMARLPDLVGFAQRHGLKLGTIADLIAYRRRNDHFIKRVAETDFESRNGGKFRLYVYHNTLDGLEHVALVKGDLSGPEPPLVRMHAINLFEDLLAGKTGAGDVIGASMRMIGEAGRGAIVVLRHKLPPPLSDTLLRPRGPRSADAEENRLKEYGVGAQILLDLGIERMVLLTNKSGRRVVALKGYGLEIVETRPIMFGTDTNT